MINQEKLNEKIDNPQKKPSIFRKVSHRLMSNIVD